MKADCVFCSIIAGKIPSKIIASYDDIWVIQDIAPQAPVHMLIMPKKHIDNLSACSVQDMAIVTRMMSVAQDLAKTLPDSAAFRLIMNNGLQAGQTVFHMHLHMLSGKQMSEGA